MNEDNYEARLKNLTELANNEFFENVQRIKENIKVKPRELVIHQCDTCGKVGVYDAQLKNGSCIWGCGGDMSISYKGSIEHLENMTGVEKEKWEVMDVGLQD